MGQEEILHFLEEMFKINPNKFFTTKEIREGIYKLRGRKPSIDSVRDCLIRLRKYKEIEFYRKGRTYYYRAKIRGY